MKKTLGFLLVMVLTFPGALGAYDGASDFVPSPSELEPGKGILKIDHRFLGSLTEDPFNTLFSLSTGSNVALSVQARFLPWLEAGAGYQVLGQAYHLLLAFPFALGDAGFLQASWQGKTTWDGSNRGWSQAEWISWSTPRLGDAWSFHTALGGDPVTGTWAWGLGMDWQILDIDEEKWGLAADLVPLNQNGWLGTWSAGMKLATFNHQFFLFVGNTSYTDFQGNWQLPQPVNLHLGFRIERRFTFF